MQRASPRAHVGAPPRDLRGAVPADMCDRAAGVARDRDLRRLCRTADPRCAERTVGDAAVGEVASKRTVPSGANSVNAPAVPEPTNAPPSGSCSRFPIAHVIRGVSGSVLTDEACAHRAHVEREPDRSRVRRRGRRGGVVVEDRQRSVGVAAHVVLERELGARDDREVAVLAAEPPEDRAGLRGAPCRPSTCAAPRRAGARRCRHRPSSDGSSRRRRPSRSAEYDSSSGTCAEAAPLGQHLPGRDVDLLDHALGRAGRSPSRRPRCRSNGMFE